MKIKKQGIFFLVFVITTVLWGCREEQLSVSDVVSGSSVSAQAVSGQVVSPQAVSGQAVEIGEDVVELAEGELFRYVSKDCFYTDFEGESRVQRSDEVEDANTICQRSLRGELIHSYPMGDDFGGILYVDEDWLYYSDVEERKVEPDEDKGVTMEWDESGWQEYSLEYTVTVYRAPISRDTGEEIPDFSKKELLFSEEGGMGGSDFSENSFLRIADDMIYYFAGPGLGTYNLKTKEKKYYPVHDEEEDYMNAAGKRYMISEGEKQCDVLTDLATGKSEVLHLDRSHPWLRLGKEYYFRYPYSPFPVVGILMDLDTGETMEVISQKEGERVAEEVGIPWDKHWLSSDGWDGIDIEYIGYYDHRVYAEIHYPTAVKDKDGKKFRFTDSVCVSRNMDEEKGWTIEKEITSHARKKIKKYYRQVKEGTYKGKKNDEYEVSIGEGVANGIFYFVGVYQKDGRMAMDVYDLKKKELRVIGRNSPETFYPFYDNSHEIMLSRHHWHGIRSLVPLMGQWEELWEQEQKRKKK